MFRSTFPDFENASISETIDLDKVYTDLIKSFELVFTQYGFNFLSVK